MLFLKQWWPMLIFGLVAGTTLFIMVRRGISYRGKRNRRWHRPDI